MFGRRQKDPPLHYLGPLGIWVPSHCSSYPQLWLDSQGPLTPTSPEDKQMDFFSLHSQVQQCVFLYHHPHYFQAKEKILGDIHLISCNVCLCDYLRRLFLKIWTWPKCASAPPHQTSLLQPHRKKIATVVCAPPQYHVTTTRCAWFIEIACPLN